VNEPLTWTCHICGSERPDSKIGVATHSLVSPTGIEVKQNVRYCNDRPACGASAMVHNLTDLALIQSRTEIVALKQLDEWHHEDARRGPRHFIVGILGGVAIGVATAFAYLGAHL
jgi:hypothetical protein